MAVENIINKFLYTGAAPGEKLATQQAVKNMSYGQIGKNILAEGAFGKNVGPASSLRGYDPNYTGKGAIPRNTAFQRMMAPLKYSAGALDINNKANNLAGGTPAQRQLYEKVLQSPVSKAASGIMNFAPKALRTLASGPAQAAMFTLGSTPANASEANMSPEDFAALAEAEGMTYGSSPITSSPFVDAGRDFSMFDQARMGDAVSGTNVQSQNYNMDQSFYMNPNSVERPQNMFQRAGNAVQGGLESLRNKAGSIADFMPFIGDKSLTGMAMRGLGKVGKGIGNFFQGNPEQRARNEYNSQFSTGDTYGYGMGSASGANKDAFGYNTVSGFGNYEQHMIDKVEELEDLLTKTGRTGFKPGTPNFNMLKDYNISINKIQQDNKIKQEEAAAAKALAAANTGYTNRGTKIDFGDYYNADGTANTSSSLNPSNSVGPTSKSGMTARAAKGGLIGYQNGGLASMFVRRG